MIVRGDAGDRYPWEPITLAQQLARTAATHPDRDALVFEERRLSWAQTQVEVTRVARALRAAGIERGDHVAVWVPNHIEWILLWLAANSIGAVIVAINTRYKTEEVAYILRQSDAKLLVMVGQFVGIDYLAMLARLREEDLPELRDVVVIGTPEWDAFLDAPAVDVDVDAIAYDDPSFIVYTSGTTGYPKGAVHSSRVLRNECSISEAMDIDSSSRVMNHMPFFHIAGACTGVLPPLITGGAMILMERWDVEEAFRLIERERVTVLSGIPTHFIDLLNHDALATTDVSSLKTGWIGGANNPPEVIQAIVDRLGMKGILPVYGMTETTSITTIPRLDDPPAVITSGKGFPVSDFELKVVDAVTGEALDAEREGEVCVRGHLVMQGYYENPEATAAVIDADGWFHTGDLANVAVDGSYTIVGRAKELIISGGENIHPVEIENALMEHPAVAECAAFGVADARWGEAVAVAIVLKAPASEAELRDHLAAQLARYKLPRRWFFVDTLPKTALGKVQRNLLVKRCS